MRHLLAVAIVLAPLVALADDEAVPAEAPPVEAPPVEAPPAEAPPTDAPPYVEPVEPVVAAPGQTAPAAPPPVENGWRCDTHRRWHRWSDSRQRRFFGVGLAKGKLALDDDQHGDQESLFFRAQSRRGWGLELEFARATIDENQARSIGGSLYKAFGKHALQPYVLAGGGRGHIEHTDGSDDRMRYFEAGGGLMLRGRHLAIGLDLRRGVRHVDAELPTMTAARMSTTTTSDDRDDYLRGRILAMFAF